MPASTYPRALTLTNPGAESGSATGWTAVSPMTAVPTATNDGSNAHSGSWYFTAAASAANTVWAQTVTISDTDVQTDIDDGILQCTASWWHAGFTDTDSGALALEFFDGSAVWLGGHFPDQTDPSTLPTYTQENLTVYVPPLTRSIRISGRFNRVTGTELSTYIDDISLSLDESGGRCYFLYALNTASVTGWTNVTGTLSATTQSGGFQQPILYWSSSASGEAYKSITISDTDAQTDIDTGTAVLYLYMNTNGFDASDTGRYYVEFFDGSAVIIGSRVYNLPSAYNVSTAMGQDDSFHLTIPVGARSIRFGKVGTRGSGSSLDHRTSFPTIYIFFDEIIPANAISITQQVLLTPAISTAFHKITQQVLLVPVRTTTFHRITQQVLLIPTRKGHQTTFSVFKEPTFHDWVQYGANVNYDSYMDTWTIIPDNDTIDWSQTPYTYFFLRNSTTNDNSLQVQYAWDWSRKDN